MVWGYISVNEMGSLYIWKCVVDLDKYIQVLEQSMLPVRQQKRLYFSKTMLNGIHYYNMASYY